MNPTLFLRYLTTALYRISCTDYCTVFILANSCEHYDAVISCFIHRIVWLPSANYSRSDEVILLFFFLRNDIISTLMEAVLYRTVPFEG